MKNLLNKQLSVKSLLIIIMVTFLSITALAAANKQIQATLASDITIKYEGVVREMSDANGKTVYPLSYEYTTYLPIRAISDMLGINVVWDGDTQTVLLSNRVPGDEERLIDVATSSNTKKVVPTTDTSNFPDLCDAQGNILRAYDFALRFSGFHIGNTLDSNMALDKGFSSLSFDIVYAVSGGPLYTSAPVTVQLFNADTGFMLWECVLDVEEFKTNVTVDIKGAETLRWTVNGGSIPGLVGTDNIIYILEPYVL